MTTPTRDSRLISVEELQKDMDVSRRTIERLMDEGLLERVKVRSRTFVTRASFEAFVKRGGSK